MRTRKIKAELPVEDLALLKQMAREQGITMTDVIRRSLWSLDYFARLKKRGETLLVEHKNGDVSRIVTDMF